MSHPITHHADQNRFELEADGAIARLDYETHGNTLLITHTFVPESLRGKGLGAVLVQHALDYSRSHHHELESRCGFATRYLATQSKPTPS